MPTSSTSKYPAKLLHRRWLSSSTFELELARPRLFQFLPGQRVRLYHEGKERNYSLISTTDDPSLALCVRRVDGGTFSPLLATAKIGTRFHLSGPHGYLTFRSSRRPAVFVATGVGIAPFVSIVRSGMTSSTLLHGVRTPAELYYESLFRGATRCYVPCLSVLPSETEPPPDSFSGRVTEYLISHLQPGLYDFYLCGRSEMVRDVTLLIDERFSGSMVYTEIFF
jgi:benzoate/toluate 1,2-dioxygenase reductase component